MIRILLFLLICLRVPAATLNSDGSASDTSTQITSASTGDTVLLPSSGSFSWTATVSLPTTKAITLDLNGSTITLSGASGKLTINAHATGNNKVRNGVVLKSGTSYQDNDGPFEINDTRGSGGIIVEGITFAGAGQALADAVLISAQGQGPGVMYNCTFTNMAWADEFIHFDGWGGASTAGWTQDSNNSLAGSSGIFYVENCNFKQTPSQSGVSWIQGYYGTRVVFRYNLFNHCSVDMHGTAGNIGARWWEFYGNTWSNTVSGTGSSPLMNIRAGTGICTDNTNRVSSGMSGSIQLCEENSGYPADYQVGRDINQTADIASVWSNVSVTMLPDECDAEEIIGMVVAGRDVTNIARVGYSPYTYPHPLREGPAAPSGPGNTGLKVRGVRNKR